jgi:acetyltransferase-like isoleucine patch superfamily enzyme
MLTARLRLAGIGIKRAGCIGRQPILRLQGRVALGEGILVRGDLSRAEFGAMPGGILEIGDRAFLNQGSSVVARKQITIGDDFHCANFAAVLDSDYHPLDEGAPVREEAVAIGDNVWIGWGAIVLPGCSIGDHSVVAAGAVVTKSVERLTLVAGNPARPVRPIKASPSWRRT